MYLPLAGVEISGWLLLAVGFCVGVLGGFFGIGGGFFVTPALNIFGFPMAYAIGTDLAQIMGKSVVATFKHRKLGNVDLRLGLLMIIGTGIGVEVGIESVLYLEEIGIVDSVVRAIYILLLGGTGAYMLFDYWKFKKEEEEGKEKIAVAERVGSKLSEMVQRINLPPKVALPQSKIKSISVWAILLVGFITGFLAGFIGVGGGFIRMPAMIYALGVPTTVAIGTDLFEIIFSSAIGTFLYATEGRVEIVAAAVMVSGGAIGAQIGTIGTRYVRGMKIRFYFALTILLAALSVILKQLAVSLSIPVLGTYAGYLILSVAGLMSLNITLCTVKGIIEERAAYSEVKRRLRILLASGGSHHAQRAIRLGARLAKGYGAEVTLLVVKDPKEEIDVPEVQRRAGRVLKELGVRAELTVRHGRPAKEILKASKDHDILVIGSHGTKSITERLLGDNATHIVENMRTSTLVVKRKAEVTKILACVNLPRYRKAVVMRAIEFAKILGVPLVFLYVLPEPLMYPIRRFHLSREELMELYPEKYEAAEELLELARSEGVEASVRFREGLPEEEILLEKREQGCDLVILGDSGWRGMLGELIGSLSGHIVKHARVSVLVVHRKA
ncbi:TSUP family transporter [Candidatus Pyrohabitans sp.]